MNYDMSKDEDNACGNEDDGIEESIFILFIPFFSNQSFFF